MNVQAHMSGQTSGQVPNQGSIPQQNGNSQMQIIGGGSAPVGTGVVPPRPVSAMDHELLKLRQCMRSKIFTILQQRQSSPANDASRAKFMDVARRLEEGLLKMAVTKDEYVNPKTLEARLASLIKGRHLNNYNNRQVNSSSTVGMMIPTPGLPPSGGNQNLMVSSSVDSSMVGSNVTATTAANTGSLLTTAGIHGGNHLSNGYQQSSANFSVGSGGNMASIGSQRITSQMIPTPGFNNSSKNNYSNNNSQSYMNVETSNDGDGFSAVESTIVQQPQQQQRQHVGGQNSRILHNLGSQMGAGFRSGLQQKSYGLLNGSATDGMEINGNSVQIVSEPSTSVGFMSGLPYTNSSRNLPQTFDNLQQSGAHGEGYGASNPHPLGSGNFFNAVTSVGPITNIQSINSHSIPRTNSSLISTQSNQQGMQQVLPLKHESVDPFENKTFQSSFPPAPRQHLPQSHQQQHLQQQPNNQYQQQQQFVHQQQQMKQCSQQQERLVNNDGYGQSQLASDLVTEVKIGPGLQSQKELKLSQTSELLQMSQLQNKFLNSAEDNSVSAQPLSVPTSDICSSLPQNDQQRQQMMHSQHSSLESANDASGLQDQWHSQSQEKTQMSKSMPNKLQHVQEAFRQRMSGVEEAQLNNLSSEGSIVGQIHASGMDSKSQNAQNSVGPMYRSGNGNRDPRFRNQQRWLLFLRHARTCKAPEGKCQDPNCITVQKLWRHMHSCTAPRCTHPRCHHTKSLIYHHRNCRDPQCPVCVPVKSYLQQQAEARAIARLKSDSVLPISTGGSGKLSDTGHASAGTVSNTASCADITENPQPASKRLKAEQSSQPFVPETESSANSVATVNEVESSQDVGRKDYQHVDVCASIKSEALEVKLEIPDVSIRGSPCTSQTKKDIAENMPKQRPVGDPVVPDEFACSPKEKNFKLEEETAKNKNPTQSCEPASKSGKPKIKGVSLTELFNPEQVREHICGLRRWVGQSKSKAEKNQAMEHSMSENSCQLCAVEKLTFEPPPIYCTPCGARIKRNAMYYTMGAGETRHYFCTLCYNESRGDAIVAEGTRIPKAKLEKKKNDEETEEWWVQCDKCEAWQHQICALFNGRRNDGGLAEYTCPNCYIAEVERGERKPLPQSAVLGAKDLPRTILSDHIEQRLFRRLKHERMERASVQRRSYDEVPGAEALVVRVVSSVDKKLEVKPRFLEIFREENYPTEFPYKSKVVLLFQNIEGVEVCLFGMYVQEFGSECEFPNQRRVYLSYLDSVKYFRPEVKAVSGEALRTIVYHEILIGYLEYCKLRGFTSCYIWACPPLKGEDYILYCHPEIQKTPKSDKLREWYLSMLRKAAKESIVVECTNFYDHFFVQTGECRAKVTASRLPYFDGDYWPGAAEDLLYQMNQEEEDRKSNKKGLIKKTITKRALKATGQSDLSGNASKDLLLMHKLGETIHQMKEDFIMVHLQYCCTRCCILMVSGNRWVCKQCKNFQICDKCYEVEQKREDGERHPVNQKDKHTLYPVEITDVPVDTMDKDEILESEFFDTRQAFLSLCQGNHYQYDTLRRAKHSSMMVLYHLHNPTAPAFVTTCKICHLDIETGQGWRCEVCPDYDLCNACHSKGSGSNHPHKLSNHPSLADQNAQNKEARQLRFLQLRKMLDLLVHASQCRSPHCQYPNCRKVKGLFRHGIQCKVRVSGGCFLCKKMWDLLQLHARACKESKCHVPRCKDLKEHLRRMQQQSDSRRRAAVMEMMRQRAAEVAGNPG